MAPAKTNSVQDREIYDAARKIVEKFYPYVIQKKNEKTGQWLTVTAQVIGKEAGYAMLNGLRERHPEDQWRCVYKAEADKYAEGWKAAVTYMTNPPEAARAHGG